MEQASPTSDWIIDQILEQNYQVALNEVQLWKVQTSVSLGSPYNTHVLTAEYMLFTGIFEPRITREQFVFKGFH